jgi:hypothetical protein
MSATYTEQITAWEAVEDKFQALNSLALNNYVLGNTFVCDGMADHLTALADYITARLTALYAAQARAERLRQ